MNTNETKQPVKRPSQKPPTLLEIDHAVARRIGDVAQAMGISMDEVASILLGQFVLNPGCYWDIPCMLSEARSFTQSEREFLDQRMKRLFAKWDKQVLPKLPSPERRPVFLPAAMVDCLTAIVEAGEMNDDGTARGVADLVEFQVEGSLEEAKTSTSRNPQGLIYHISENFQLTSRRRRVAAMVKAAKANPYTPRDWNA